MTVSEIHREKIEVVAEDRDAQVSAPGDYFLKNR
jgi:hypothetical protein